MKKLIRSKLARRFMRDKKKNQIPQPTGAKDLAKAIFAVADKNMADKLVNKNRKK